MDERWISLVGDGVLTLLYARHEVTLGKLCEPPVNICLRKYPEERFRDDCLRIGRNHLRLGYNPQSNLMEFIDQGSTHGTTLDGVRLLPLKPTPLPIDRPLALVVAGSLALVGRVFARREAVTAAVAKSGSIACGIDQAHALDACVLTRPDNHPGMSYAMVLRRVTIGGLDAYIPLPGVLRASIEIALLADRWVWRATPSAAWMPLVAGTVLEVEGRRLRAVPGNYDQFIGVG
jgi:hypothetical protein